MENRKQIKLWEKEKSNLFLKFDILLLQLFFLMSKQRSSYSFQNSEQILNTTSILIFALFVWRVNQNYIIFSNLSVPNNWSLEYSMHTKDSRLGRVDNRSSKQWAKHSTITRYNNIKNRSTKQWTIWSTITRYNNINNRSTKQWTICSTITRYYNIKNRSTKQLNIHVLHHY